MKLLLIACATLVAAALPAAAQSYAPGQWVLARANDGSTHMYPGVVAGATAATVTINFDDGTRETRRTSEVRPYDWKVGSKITCIWANDGKYYPAVITRVGADGSSIRIRYPDDNSSADVTTGSCYAN